MKKTVAGGGGQDGGPLKISKVKIRKETPSVKQMKELELPKTKLQPEHFSVFKYGHHYSISIRKNYSNNTTCREDINKICIALFGKPRYTKEQLIALKDSGIL